LQALLEKGLHKINKRRPVPLVPLRLGVVSSTQAAGWADARERLEQSGIGFTVSFVDVRVQGDDAPLQIASALKMLSRRDDIDIVLLMRGGGAKGDLAAFDDERVALAVANCRHPVFTGIGHQIDESIADVMAHTKFITPTACANGVISLVNDFTESLRDAQRELRLCTENSLIRARGRLVMSLERLKTRPRNALSRQTQVLTMHASALRLLDPAVTMARGWSIARDADGNIIRSKEQVTVGDSITVSLTDGTITGTVEGITS
jgi:exodeoxyribonuclease VII large subunit